MSKHWVQFKLTWLFFIIEINKTLNNILFFLSEALRYKIADIWIYMFGGFCCCCCCLYTCCCLTIESITVLTEPNIYKDKQKSFLFILTKSIRLFTHLLNTCQKLFFLVSIKSNFIIKIYFVYIYIFKKPRFSNSLCYFATLASLSFNIV